MLPLGAAALFLAVGAQSLFADAHYLFLEVSRPVAGTPIQLVFE